MLAARLRHRRLRPAQRRHVAARRLRDHTEAGSDG